MNLLEAIKIGQVNTFTGLEKLAKVTQFSFAQAKVIEVQNQDLVNIGKEAQKKKHQLTGDLRKARVLSRKAGKKVLEEREGNKFNK